MRLAMTALRLAMTALRLAMTGAPPNDAVAAEEMCR